MKGASLTLHLGAPRHAVAPQVLAQRLPLLAAALRAFSVQSLGVQIAASVAAPVLIYGAVLGVQRDHLTLEALPSIGEDARLSLQALCADLAASHGLQFVPNHGADKALGEINLNLALPLTAPFIGRNVALALPKTAEYQPLRQCFNASQMQLHAQPLADSPVNSLWFAQAAPQDGLSGVWLEGGMTAWWDALPAWDAAASSLIGSGGELQFVFSDQTICVTLRPRPRWALWQTPAALEAVLEHAA